MKAVVQRVERAAVRVVGEAEPTGEIGPGMLVLLGVAKGDDDATAHRMADKIRGLRIFPDDAGRMSRNVGDAVFSPDAAPGGPSRANDGRAPVRILVVSQFTLLADTRKGTRPSFTGAAAPDLAERLYELVADALGAAKGRFGGDMRIELVADGPVTIALEVNPPEARLGRVPLRSRLPSNGSRPRHSRAPHHEELHGSAGRAQCGS